MTPSLMGRMATMFPGVRPIIRLASIPTARTFFVPRLSRWTATQDGSEQMIPSPFTYTRVVAVPRSMARSCENRPSRRSKIILSPPDVGKTVPALERYRGIVAAPPGRRNRRADPAGGYPRIPRKSRDNPVEIHRASALKCYVRHDTTFPEEQEKTNRHARRAPPERRFLGHQDRALLHRTHLHLVGGRDVLREGPERGRHGRRRDGHDGRTGRDGRGPREDVPGGVRSRLHPRDGQDARPAEAGPGVADPAQDPPFGSRPHGAVRHGHGGAAG